MAYSYPKIIEIAKYCPVPLSVTSTKRSGNSDYHDFGLAVDFAALYRSTPRKQADAMMRDAAVWWYQYSPRLLELIHTTPFFTDNGFYVKHGVRRPPGFYGWATESAHYDHVHVAMSDAAATILLNALKKRYGAPRTRRVYRADGTYYYPVRTAGTYHTIAKRETLSGIARKYKTTVAKIMNLNTKTLKSPHLIKVGQKIRVK